MLLQFFAVKDTPSSEEIRFLARQVRFSYLRSLQYMIVIERRTTCEYWLFAFCNVCADSTMRAANTQLPVPTQLEPVPAVHVPSRPHA